MSRTKESPNIPSPVEVAIFFNGNTGQLGAPVDNEDSMVNFQLPFSFIVLDDGGFKITGDNRATTPKRKIVSNLVHRDYYTQLTVSYKDTGEVIASGEWSQIGRTVKEVGGKYTLVLYVLAKIENTYKIAALHFRGRALAEWFRFVNGKNIFGDCAFQVTGVEKTQGQDTDSNVPTFKEIKVSADAVAEAEAADAILQNWLGAYFPNDLNIAQAKPAPQPTPQPQSTLHNPPSSGYNFPTAPEGAVATAQPEANDDLPF